MFALIFGATNVPMIRAVFIMVCGALIKIMFPNGRNIVHYGICKWFVHVFGLTIAIVSVGNGEIRDSYKKYGSKKGSGVFGLGWDRLKGNLSI